VAVSSLYKREALSGTRTLDPLLTIQVAKEEQEGTAALDTVAGVLGYDGESARRTFRARHWREASERIPPGRGIER
jgi:hypothetical protein